VPPSPSPTHSATGHPVTHPPQHHHARAGFVTHPPARRPVGDRRSTNTTLCAAHQEDNGPDRPQQPPNRPGRSPRPPTCANAPSHLRASNSQSRTLNPPDPGQRHFAVSQRPLVGVTPRGVGWLVSRGPAAGLVTCGFARVAGVAQPAAVARVVGVESECHEFHSTAWMVVCVCGACVSAEDADGVAGEDCCPEPLAVGLVVAACCCAASCSLCLACALVAA
jgi:hypothetical protein